MRTLFFMIFGFLCVLTVSQDAKKIPEEKCTVTFPGGVVPPVDELLKNPPDNWNFACFTTKLVNEFLEKRERVAAVVECIKDVNLCKSPGYKIISNEIIDRIGSSGICTNCTSKQVEKIVKYIVHQLRERYSDLYREGLTHLA